MADPLTGIEKQLGGKRNFEAPPLQLWDPPLSGDIAIEIRRDGSWHHDGDPIRRESLVRLFASILRRESDGEYYLVTPAEKWRVSVEAHALLVTDVEQRDGELVVQLASGRSATISDEFPLFIDAECDNVAAIRLWHGLTALFNRNAWYRLVELADAEGRVHSGPYSAILTPTP